VERLDAIATFPGVLGWLELQPHTFGEYLPPDTLVSYQLDRTVDPVLFVFVSANFFAVIFSLVHTDFSERFSAREPFGGISRIVRARRIA
jgi:hypothetical protein